jgi:ABC-type uncharacterized transport system permease subunit
VYFAYTRVSMLLGRLLIPIDLLPDKIATVARLLPFAPKIHGPARLALATDASGLVGMLTSPAMSMAIVRGLVALAYQNALAQVTV